MPQFVRQTILPELGEEGQQRLEEASVLVVGCGALGSHTAEILARAGVGDLILVDRDVVEETNLHRVSLFTPDEVGQPKAHAAAILLRRIAPHATIAAHVVHFGPREAEELVPSVDLVVDGLDNLSTRYLVNDACVKHGVPWVYTAVLSTYGMTMPIVPAGGPCLRCVFPDPPSRGAIPTCAEAGILGPVPAALAALQATTAIQILARGSALAPGRLVHLDLWTGRAELVSVARAPDCPCCGKRQFEFLAQRDPAEILCGDSVQILPQRRERLDLERLAARLRVLGEARVAHGVLVAAVEGIGLTVFPDGRAIVKGISDPHRAQALYDQYLAA
ncbi:MAG: Molybdopterin-synthase adenylyltransferase [Candidatus Bipolaricaulis sibiricus]|uniref:Molybdopterin-synthase adenylyltransferase n=1 Tax=Bipolaricaulis sibiricus TaxID=2501609 RepID=A0A410FWH3_BIPS1|nr:MAG: Molybdopterin-synthase adenylyltransferase [Candidatus Bipolaricaulis sibiricus]